METFTEETAVAHDDGAGRRIRRSAADSTRAASRRPVVKRACRAASARVEPARRALRHRNDNGILDAAAAQRIASAQSRSVAPVVQTSSTSVTRFDCDAAGVADENVPERLAVRDAISRVAHRRVAVRARRRRSRLRSLRPAARSPPRRRSRECAGAGAPSVPGRAANRPHERRDQAAERFGYVPPPVFYREHRGAQSSLVATERRDAQALEA